ncbi:thymic stromal lymphopoietin [Vicugna pacos]|uniref:Thymic stromal lymphopoietin n=1 Tax=Vicugna pacos TaxID=30538 RepID=A0ABM5D2A7_VICPA
MLRWSFKDSVIAPVFFRKIFILQLVGLALTYNFTDCDFEKIKETYQNVIYEVLKEYIKGTKSIRFNRFVYCEDGAAGFPGDADPVGTTGLPENSALVPSLGLLFQFRVRKSLESERDSGRGSSPDPIKRKGKSCSGTRGQRQGHPSRGASLRARPRPSGLEPWAGRAGRECFLLNRPLPVSQHLCSLRLPRALCPLLTRYLFPSTRIAFIVTPAHPPPPPLPLSLTSYQLFFFFLLDLPPPAFSSFLVRFAACEQPDCLTKIERFTFERNHGCTSLASEIFAEQTNATFALHCAGYPGIEISITQAMKTRREREVKTNKCLEQVSKLIELWRRFCRIKQSKTSLKSHFTATE